MLSKMSGLLYHVVDCSKFYGQIFYPQPAVFQYICSKIGHQANPGVICLTYSILNPRCSPLIWDQEKVATRWDNQNSYSEPLAVGHKSAK